MAQQISRIADILNEEFETNIDGGALEGAIRSGAGLPEKK